MTIWEYIYMDDSPNRWCTTRAAAFLGKLGWELVHLSERATQAIFKRELRMDQVSASSCIQRWKASEMGDTVRLTLGS